MLFQVMNHHVVDSGEPPSINGDDGNWHSYFQNEHGEQWLFTYNRSEDRVYVRGGDNGWENIFGLQHMQNIVFSPAEKAWLAACMLSIGIEPDKIPRIGAL